MANVDNPSVVLDVREVQAAAQTLGLEATTADIRRAADIAGAFAAVTARVEALYVAGDPLVTTNRTRLAILAAARGCRPFTLIARTPTPAA